MITERPILPPPFRPVAVAPGRDPVAQARIAAEGGAEDGTVLWSMRADALDAAVVLVPETSLERALPVVYAALLGLGDSLGALAPPQVAVTFGWPDRVEVNGAAVGGVRVAAPVDSPGEVPPWLVLGVTVAVAPDPGAPEPGHDIRRTTLRDEGCGGISALDLLESFGRHFLHWVDRWQTDGFRPLKDAYLGRATGFGTPMALTLDGDRHEGAFMGLTETGNMLLVHGGATRTVALGRALRTPTWTGPGAA